MSFILAAATAVFALVADQVVKYIVATNMQLYQTIDFIDGFLDFTFIYNDGGAWGILGGNRWLLLGSTAVIMTVLIIMLIKDRLKSKLFFWAACLVISGGLGNMIDRIFRSGKVVDFIHATFIDFPIFNIADCAVVIGAGLLILYFVLDIIKDEKQRKSQNAERTEN